MLDPKIFKLKFYSYHYLLFFGICPYSIYMYKCRNIGQQFTVVDLDPYGSAAIFLDPAVQATEDGGIQQTCIINCTR